MPEFLLEKICRQPDCVAFRGCSSEEIKKLKDELAAGGFCTLPEEYAVLLQKYNGIIYDGLELLGTIPHKRLQKNYTLGSILDINRRYAKIGFFTQKLILGELPESFLIYDGETGNYEIVDRLNLDSRRIFNTLKEFFRIISAFLTLKD